MHVKYVDTESIRVSEHSMKDRSSSSNSSSGLLSHNSTRVIVVTRLFSIKT